jgi:hypothetical protein
MLSDPALVNATRPAGVRLFIPVNGVLSVMRGAILYGLDPSVVQQRCSRFTYGVEITAPFRAVHDMSRRYILAPHSP